VKHLPIFLLAAALLALTGCDSVSTRVHERFSGPVYQVKIVNVDQHKAYEVARIALTKMDFNFEHGGPAQGIIHAIGPLHPSPSAPGTARQLWFDAKLSPALEGGTKIEVLFSEMVEEDFNKRPGQGTLTPLRDSSVYEAYFQYIDEILTAKP